MNIPSDPVILLSIVNTYLRDKYSSIEDLCEYEDVSYSEIVEKLEKINYKYNADMNKFI